jgi:ABC-type nitrate/sulfonate/bicarbonate transport system substrate-binding protein
VSVQPRSWLQIPKDDNRPHRRLRLSAAHDEWNHVGIALAAMEEGFFADEGLDDVELVTFPEESGALLDRESYQAELLASGAADIGIDPRTTFLLEAKDAGRPVVIVAARRKNHAFVLIGQKDVTSLEQLRGATLYQSEPGGATDVMLKQVMKDKGYEIGRDWNLEYIGGQMHDGVRVAQAFREGKHGPAMLSSTGQLQSFIDAGYPVLADLRTMYPSRHDRVTGANERFVSEHPDMLLGFLKGMIRGCRWVLNLDNQARFKQIIMDSGFLTSERERVGWDDLYLGWQVRGTRDLELPMEGIDLIIDEEKRAGKIAQSFQRDDVLRLDTLRRAQIDLSDEPDA